jgi:hypothetical protein
MSIMTHNLLVVLSLAWILTAPTQVNGGLIDDAKRAFEQKVDEKLEQKVGQMVEQEMVKQKENMMRESKDKVSTVFYMLGGLVLLRMFGPRFFRGIQAWILSKISPRSGKVIPE